MHVRYVQKYEEEAMTPIKNEYDYLIHLLRCAVRNEQPTQVPEGISLEAVYKLAIEHDVANIAYISIERLKDKPSDELMTRWRLRRDFAIERDINQSFARDEIVKEFRRLGIRSLEVQGTKIKALYPSPDLRTMSDIDFIIDFDRIEEAREALRSLGYSCKWLGDVEIDGFRPPNIYVELHTGYFPANSDYHDCMRPPFSYTEGNDVYDELYIYSLLHIAKHYFEGGCGIRRVLDVHYLNANLSEKIDRAYAEAVFRKAGVLTFVESISLLANYWFADGMLSERLEYMIQFIIGSSLHGTRENQMGAFLRKTYGDEAKFVKTRHIAKRIFAGDDVMLRHYPFLKKWRALYPFCWGHRIARVTLRSKEYKIADKLKMILRADLHKR